MTQAVDRYLAMRQAAGFDLVNAAYLLRSFAHMAAERGDTHVRAATAIEWASRGPTVAQRDARLKTICRFARYVQPEDGRHDVPPVKHFGTHKIRRVPHIYSPADITRLLAAARQLGPPERLHPHTYATLIALLAATGMRISEALSLQLTDVTPRGLVIRKTKFQKTRLVPLHDTTQAGLERYLTCRRHAMPHDEHVFVTDDGRPLRYQAVYPTFQTLVKLAGLGASAVIVHVCTSSGTHLRFERWRPVRLAASASVSTWWPWRRTWVTSTSAPPTGIWKPRPTCCARSPRRAKHS